MRDVPKVRNERCYDEGRLSLMVLMVFIAVYTLVIVIYFYLILKDLIICIIIAGVCFPFAIISFKKYLVKRRIKCLESQFGEALSFISSSLSAGNTIESSFFEFVANSENYNKGNLSIIVREFRNITNRVEMHESITNAFSSFAYRSGSSDIKVFALALSQIYVSGGDMVGLVRKTAASLRIKRETEDEIDLILTGPKYNHRLMTIMPVLIIFLMNFISPDYMAALHNGPGKVVAVVAAVLITVAYIIGNRISDIKF